ncbi:MAG: O-linked N-acetylglucosamine transferase, SPINDLY family protein, partial [Burkholderiales bacterium]
ILSDSAAEQLQCARTYAARKYPVISPLWVGERYRHDRIRIAYLSADFYLHATSHLMVELFERHDKMHFEVSAWSFGPDTRDAMRARLQKSFEQFHDVRIQSDTEVAALLRAQEIDIAIDLKGFTDGCRPAIFARRVAPIQVNYLGYPGTTGADYMDYIIGDAEVIPEGHDDFYSERVVRLPDSYQVNDSKRVISGRVPGRAEAGLPESGFVFSCFNNSYKITPEVFAVWMRLLQRVEGSVLWLLEDNAAASRNLRLEAEAMGVRADRLVFAPRLLPPDHLARHRLADLFLDTLPCNAHTTASDALWAGLPLLTCRGHAFPGRVAASLLRAIGLPELITDSLADYEALAFRLATTPALLADIQSRLAQNKTTHPLFDIDRYRRHIESAYITMHERYQRGEVPQGFSVKQQP